MDQRQSVRTIALIGVAFVSGIFLRYLPFDYVWWYEVVGQLSLTTIVSLFWRWSSLLQKIKLLVFSLFVGWLTDWIVHAIRFQPDDWVAMKAGFVLLGMQSALGLALLLIFHFCLQRPVCRETSEPIRVIE